MVTDRYHGARGARPASLAAALGMSAVMVSGLVLSSPAVQAIVDKPLTAVNIALAPPPEPDPLPPPPQPREQVRAQPVPRARPVDTTDPVVAPDAGAFTTPATGGAVAGAGTAPIDVILPPLPTPTPSPVLAQATPDPRYARDFQPAYPASEQRAGRAGLVTIRVLIGTNGRVLRAERVDAASDAFWAATERQALTRWRFRPATRDGVPVEGWRTMTVRFVMPDEG